MNTLFIPCIFRFMRYLKKFVFHLYLLTLSFHQSELAIYATVWKILYRFCLRTLIAVFISVAWIWKFTIIIEKNGKTMLRSRIKNIGNFYCDISHCDVCKCFKWGNACYNMWYNRCCNNSYNFNLYCNRN